MPARKTHRGRSKAAQAKKPADPGPQGPSEQIPIENRPEEWDFTSIREDQLEAAIVYEYARSAPWVVQVFENWHRRRLRLPKGFQKWSRLTVGEILEKMYVEDVPDEVGGALEQSKPEEFETRKLELVYLIGHLFPKPFLTLNCVYPEEDLPSLKDKAFTLLDPRGFCSELHLISQQVKKNHSRRMFAISVDLSFSKTRVKKEIEAWIDRLYRRSTISKRKVPLFKSASPPWQQLKELAAYRLKKDGTLTYEAARAHVREYQAKHRIGDPNQVLPNYNPSGFSGAVKNARKRIKKLYPAP